MLQLKEYHLKSETSSQYNIMIIIIINYLELGWTLSMRIRLLPWRFLVFGANINKLRKLITQNLRRKNQSQILIIIIAEITPHTPAKNTVKILASSGIASSSAVAVNVPDAVLPSVDPHPSCYLES